MASALLARIERRPGVAFAAFAALHAAVWTALPTALYKNLPLDLIEALTYGREWQLGYDKLPPLPWWLVEIAYRLFGADFAYYALSQIVIIATLAIVFAMARQLVGGVGALASVLIIDGLHYLNYTAPKFNHDVMQLPFWALAGFAFWSALRHRRLIDWLLLGVALGLAAWAKYFVVVLAAPLVLYMFADRNARRTLATPGPWVALAAALVTIAPHLAWLVRNDFLPFAYASARAVPSRGWVDHVLHPLAFALSQVGALAPALAIAVPLRWPRPPARVFDRSDFDHRIVTLLAFGPALTVIALSLVTGRGLVAMWGYPLWLFIGLWLVMMAGPIIDRARLARIAGLWAIVFVGFAAAFVVNYAVLPGIDHRYRAAFFPGSRLAADVAERFRAATGAPLRYVIGSMWVGGNIAHYSAEQPRVLIDGNPRRAPWIDLADLKARGAAVVWVIGDRSSVPAEYRALAPDAQVGAPFTLPARNGIGEVEVGWAILPPAK
jgi:4-amino-4-deoxy-L-arabinose transferase-like glycosyltransferase